MPRSTESSPALESVEHLSVCRKSRCRPFPSVVPPSPLPTMARVGRDPTQNLSASSDEPLGFRAYNDTSAERWPSPPAAESAANPDLDLHLTHPLFLRSLRPCPSTQIRPFLDFLHRLHGRPPSHFLAKLAQYAHFTSSYQPCLTFDPMQNDLRLSSLSFVSTTPVLASR